MLQPIWVNVTGREVDLELLSVIPGWKLKKKPPAVVPVFNEVVVSVEVLPLVGFICQREANPVVALVNR